ncbi:MAG: hypothetical protein ACM3U2_13970 [Deltaproteobacteria bacterium]
MLFAVEFELVHRILEHAGLIQERLAIGFELPAGFVQLLRLVSQILVLRLNVRDFQPVLHSQLGDLRARGFELPLRFRVSLFKLAAGVVEPGAVAFGLHPRFAEPGRFVRQGLSLGLELPAEPFEPLHLHRQTAAFDRCRFDVPAMQLEDLFESGPRALQFSSCGFLLGREARLRLFVRSLIDLQLLCRGLKPGILVADVLTVHVELPTGLIKLLRLFRQRSAFGLEALDPLPMLLAMFFELGLPGLALLAGFVEFGFQPVAGLIVCGAVEVQLPARLFQPSGLLGQQLAVGFELALRCLQLLGLPPLPLFEFAERRPVRFELPQGFVKPARSLAERLAVGLELAALSLELVAVGVELLPGGLQSVDALGRIFRHSGEIDLPFLELFDLLAESLPLALEFVGLRCHPPAVILEPLHFRRERIALARKLTPLGVEAFAVGVQLLPGGLQRLRAFRRLLGRLQQIALPRLELFHLLSERRLFALEIGAAGIETLELFVEGLPLGLDLPAFGGDLFAKAVGLRNRRRLRAPPRRLRSISEQRPQNSGFGGIDGLAEIRILPKVHSPQHFPIQMRGTGDPFVRRDGGVAGDRHRVGDPVGISRQIVAGEGLQQRLGGTDRRKGGIRRVCRALVGRDRLVGKDDGPHRRFFDGAEFDRVHVVSRSQPLSHANRRFDGPLARSGLGMFGVDLKQGNHATRASGRERQKRK